ncbi:MAG TPA: hypothetical protein VIV40_35635 [Kofleriaceae bacterium]
MRLVIVVVVVTWSMAAALARPSITVGEAVPYSAAVLDDAVMMRGDVRADVRITRSGDSFMVTVGGASQRVAMPPGDLQDDVRVLAMVIVALDARSADAARQEDEPAAPAAATAAAQPAPDRIAVRATLGWGRDDGGTFSMPITLAFGYRVAEHAQLVASVTRMTGTAPTRGSVLFPIHLGVEGRAGGAGLEVGAFVAPQQDCVSKLTAGGGAYASGRIYVPISPTGRLVAEVTGFYAPRMAGGCDAGATLYFDTYGGYVGGGYEWSL